MAVLGCWSSGIIALGWQLGVSPGREEWVPVGASWGQGGRGGFTPALAILEASVASLSLSLCGTVLHEGLSQGFRGGESAFRATPSSCPTPP